METPILQEQSVYKRFQSWAKSGMEILTKENLVGRGTVSALQFPLAPGLRPKDFPFWPRVKWKSIDLLVGLEKGPWRNPGGAVWKSPSLSGRCFPCRLPWQGKLGSQRLRQNRPKMSRFVLTFLSKCPKEGVWSKGCVAFDGFDGFDGSGGYSHPQWKQTIVLEE